MTIKEWLKASSTDLRMSGVSSPQLDAELLLSYVLKKPREYILAHPEAELAKEQIFLRLNEALKRRAGREPLAYILGEKEFYGRVFKVSKDILVPRPESETIIDLLKSLKLSQPIIADIGTGSGCLAITAKLEWQSGQVIATDISSRALQLAKANAKEHKADIIFLKGPLLQPLINKGYRPSVILANLPYVDYSWDTSPETAYEAREALYASEGGLGLILPLIAEACGILQKGSCLVLEADPRQHEVIIKQAAGRGFVLVATKDFILALQFIGYTHQA